MENLKIGLCGTGNVGLAFAKSILNSEILIKQNYGLNISISLIGARKGKVEGLEGIPIVKNILDVTKSNDVDVVVELIGGIDDAYALAKTTLKNKKQDMLRLRKSIESRLDKLDKSNPELISNLRKA